MKSWECGSQWFRSRPLMLRLWPTGAAAVPDQQPQPRPHDGGAEWLWQVHGLEGAAEGPGALWGHGGCGACYWPQGHEQGGAVWCAGPQHSGMDWRPLHAHPQVGPCEVWVRGVCGGRLKPQHCIQVRVTAAGVCTAVDACVEFDG